MLKHSDSRQLIPQRTATTSLVTWEALEITLTAKTTSRIQSARVDTCTLQPTCLQPSKCGRRRVFGDDGKRYCAKRWEEVLARTCVVVSLAINASAIIFDEWNH